MKCKNCGLKAVHEGLCKEHFIEYYEDKVKKTVSGYNLLKKGDKIAVATSGGKDSLCVLYMIKKLIGQVTAIVIDEGIKGYRQNTLEDIKFFCESNNINLKIYSFKEEFGQSLDDMCKKLKLKPCTICGVLRRHLLNKYSRGYSVVATGHNLDDECQSIVMNYLRFNLELMARLGPKTGLILNEKLVPRIKPLYFCTEKENMVFSLLKGFKVGFVECPYAISSFRATVRDELNEYETVKKGTKLSVVKGFVKLMPLFKKYFSSAEAIKFCKTCGEPSKSDICKACLLVQKLK